MGKHAANLLNFLYLEIGQAGRLRHSPASCTRPETDPEERRTARKIVKIANGSFKALDPFEIMSMFL